MARLGRGQPFAPQVARPWLQGLVTHAVAYDAVSESHTGATGSVSEASFSWTHVPVLAPRGILVYTFVNADADDAVSVTYGAVAMTAVPGGRAVDTAIEPGDCKAWFLGSGIPTGSQSVVVTRTNTANVMYGVCVSVMAGEDTEPFGVTLQQEDQAPAEASVTDGSTGVDSVRFAGANYGGPGAVVSGANTTALIGIDFGARVARVARETTAGQGSRLVGFADAADDWACVLLAVREIVAASGVTLTLDPLAIPVVMPAPTLALALTLAPAPLAVPIVLPAPTLSLPYTLTPSALEVPVALSDPALVGTVILSPDAMAVPVVMPGPSLALSLTLIPSALAVPVVMPPPALALTLALAPSALAVSVVLPSPLLSVSQALTPAALAVSVALPAPTLALTATLAPSALVVPIVMPAPTLGLLYSLVPAALTVPIVFPAPAVTGGAVSLAPLSLAIPVALPAPTLALALTLAPGPLAILVTLPAPALAATLGLLPVPLIIPVALPAPVVSLPFLVAPSPLVIPVSFGAPTLVLSLALSPTPLDIPVLLPAPTLGFSVTTLTPDPCLIIIVITAPAVSGVTFSGGRSLIYPWYRQRGRR